MAGGAQASQAPRSRVPDPRPGAPATAWSPAGSRGCWEGAAAPRSPHLRQLQVGQATEQLPREGDHRLRFALQRGRAAGDGQQPQGQRRQERGGHGARRQEGSGCAGLGAGSCSYLWSGRAVSHPQTPRLTLPSHGDETHTQAPLFLAFNCFITLFTKHAQFCTTRRVRMGAREG